DTFDDAIIKYVRNKYKIMIGEKTAEELKVTIGSAFKGSRSLTANMKGRNLITGLPDELSISTDEIIYALKESVSLIVDSVKFVLEKTPPELAADIIERGILMTGGGSLLDGLDKLIEHETGVTVEVANNSVEAVAEGTGKVLGYLDKIDTNSSDNEITLVE
ncbi:rod shape-determining protein, partial [Clostridium tertium]